MPKVRCTLDNASTSISGHAFRRVSLAPGEFAMDSVEDLPDDVCAMFAEIPGYAVLKPEPFRPPQPNQRSADATRIGIDAALANLPDGIAKREYPNADYVLLQMRAHFGETFSADDEAAVRKMFELAPNAPLAPAKDQAKVAEPANAKPEVKADTKAPAAKK